MSGVTGIPWTGPPAHRERRIAGPAMCAGRRFRRRFRGAPAFLAVVWLLAPAPVGGQEPDPALRAVEGAAERYREVHAMCADFEQVIEVRLARRTIKSAGRVCQQRPNLFSMRFTDPGGDMVISDGAYFWIYYPSIDREQVMRQPVTRTPGRHDFFREFLEDPASKYAAGDGGTEQVNGRDCRVVSLTPLAGASYRGARLWLDTENHIIRRLELHEESGNVRTVTLSNMDLSSAPDPDLFTFEVPEGARVRGATGPGAEPSRDAPVVGPPAEPREPSRGPGAARTPASPPPPVLR